MDTNQGSSSSVANDSTFVPSILSKASTFGGADGTAITTNGPPSRAATFDVITGGGGPAGRSTAGMFMFGGRDNQAPQTSTPGSLKTLERAIEEGVKNMDHKTVVIHSLMSASDLMGLSERSYPVSGVSDNDVMEQVESFQSQVRQKKINPTSSDHVVTEPVKPEPLPEAEHQYPVSWLTGGHDYSGVSMQSSAATAASMDLAPFDANLVNSPSIPQPSGEPSCPSAYMPPVSQSIFPDLPPSAEEFTRLPENSWLDDYSNLLLADFTEDNDMPLNIEQK